MIVKERQGWDNLNVSFENWFNEEGCPSWIKQKNWLSKELVKRNFVKKKQLTEMWLVFSKLTENCSTWKLQGMILSFITLCFDNKMGERFIK